jgi:hypothetical protein
MKSGGNLAFRFTAFTRVLGLDAVQTGKVGIEDHPLPSQQKDRSTDSLFRDGTIVIGIRDSRHQFETPAETTLSTLRRFRVARRCVQCGRSHDGPTCCSGSGRPVSSTSIRTWRPTSHAPKRGRRTSARSRRNWRSTPLSREIVRSAQKRRGPRGVGPRTMALLTLDFSTSRGHRIGRRTGIGGEARGSAHCTT